jgi:group I intron endonuclease
MIIYKITNKVNGKIYVGQSKKSIEDRFQRHIKAARKKCNRYLYDAMNHYGYDNFIIEVIETDIEKEQIDEREQFWIKELSTLMPNGYNMTKGGGGGYTVEFWDEERKKEWYRNQGNKRRGKRPPEWRESIRQASFLREQSKNQETKKIISDKISNTLKEKYESGEIDINVPAPKFGKDNWNYTEVDITEVLKLIKLQWKMKDIAEKFNTTKATVVSKLKTATGKTFIEWRREYGIRGSFGKVQRIDPDQ